MKNIRHIFLRYNKVLNKKNGCNVPRNFSIKHNKQNNIMINEKEFWYRSRGKITLFKNTKGTIRTIRM